MTKIFEFSQEITNDNLNGLKLKFQEFNGKSLKFIDYFEICLLERFDFYIQFCDEITNSKIRLTDTKKSLNYEIERLKTLKNEENNELIEKLKSNDEVRSNESMKIKNFF